jgi:hypothetical protein
MATLALTVAGAALGGSLLPAGLTVFGATLTGSMIGSQIGSAAGAFIDQALFGASGQSRRIEGPRLSDLRVTTSTEGAASPRVYGRVRVGGQVIWAAELEESAVTSGGGSGKGAPAASSGAQRTDYAYFASFAVALAEGEISGIGQVWADGKELDLGRFTWRLHKGDEVQEPDPTIAAHMGGDDTPAYRGVAYIVFDRMPLEAFGNRLPQLSFEVFRSVDDFEDNIRAVVLIPGSGEFVYAPEPVTRRTGRIRTESENTHTLKGGTDWTVSLDQLAETLPNAGSISLVVSWFGTDLRVGHCQIRPAVDASEKDTSPIVWSVAGLTRETAPVASSTDDGPAYGGTPSDQTVIAAIRDLKARGHGVVLTPFVLMDIPAVNSLVDPYSGELGQPAYPWRGRITVSPAPGLAGSPDKTPAAAAAIAAFVGTATPGDFAAHASGVNYSGPDEWSLRRQVLHYAHLAVAAGGVDAIVLGSELRGLTQVRSAVGIYPFVAALVALAADVRSVVGPGTKITYAADWSEYFGHHPADGSGDVAFHLDPLWASPDIDAVAIDCYWPLADWRDGDHLDRQAGVRSIYDPDYLKGNLFAGEGYDWFYASAADREQQVRTPITDGVAGKPWVFRYKDIRSWWAEPHFDRPDGVESVVPTAWQPRSKPIWLTEIGCPAVDKGANQPNVFVDPKSSESFLPYFSRGERDDLMQRAYLKAIVEAFDPDHGGYVDGANPLSPVYGGRMLDLAHLHVYAWDARPYPTFPANALVWSDSANWPLGHWIGGRVTAQPLGAVVADLLEGHDFHDYDVSGLDGVVSGFIVDRPMSARDALQPLELAYFVDAVESDGRLRFQHRGRGDVVRQFAADDLVEVKPGADLVRLTRAQETDLPAVARIAYASAESGYRQAVSESRRLAGASGRISDAQLAIVMESAQASRVADAWLFETWMARERVRLTLPPSGVALEPGDFFALETADGRAPLYRIVEIGDRGEREIEAVAIDPALYDGGQAITRPLRPGEIDRTGPVHAVFLDLPMLTGQELPESGFVVAARDPWPGSAAFFRSPEASGFTLTAVAGRAGITGRLVDALANTGVTSRFSRGGGMRVEIDAGMLVSTTRLGLFAGANAAAVMAVDGEWEVFQFETAVLVAPSTYALSGLIRGQAGTEAAAAVGAAAGATFVLLDRGLTPVPIRQDEIGLALNWRYGPGSREIGDASYSSAVHAFRGVGLRPYSPVHVRGRRSGGDLEISWVRRTRIGGDSWTIPEVPLGEAFESYEVEILSGADVVRRIMTSEPRVTYPAVDQISDFSALPGSVAVRVAQVSDVYGRGAFGTAVV